MFYLIFDVAEVLLSREEVVGVFATEVPPEAGAELSLLFLNDCGHLVEEEQLFLLVIASSLDAELVASFVAFVHSLYVIGSIAGRN